MKLNLKLFCLLVLLSLLPLKTFAATVTNPFNQIIFFGDSLSDNGNLFAWSDDEIPAPPYVDGRFTNGPVWSEGVANYFKGKNVTDTQNYAIGGETTIMHDLSKDPWPFYLGASINDFYYHNVSSDKSKTLFVIWIGANDYLWGSNNPDLDTSNVVATIQSTVKELIASGGKNFLLVNLPDLGKIPTAQSGDPEILHTLSILHNTKLQAAATALQTANPSVNIQLYDMGALFTDLLTRTDIYNQKYHLHISNVTDACWTGGYSQQSNPQAQETAIARNLENQYQAQLKASNGKNSAAKKIDFQAMAHLIATNPVLRMTYANSKNYQDGVQACADPDAYLFWDFVHPTKVVHDIIRQTMIDFINKNF